MIRNFFNESIFKKVSMNTAKIYKDNKNLTNYFLASFKNNYLQALSLKGIQHNVSRETL